MEMKHFFWIAPTTMLMSAVPCIAIQYVSIDQAQRLCFSEASKFVLASVVLTDAQMADIEKDSGVRVRNKVQQVWKVYAGTAFLGWFISDQVIGKHDEIDWGLALNKDGTVRQCEIMEYRERYGSAIRNSEFRNQFVGKKHGDLLQLNKDIRNISGETLSSKHVTEGVKRLLSFYEIVLKKN